MKLIRYFKEKITDQISNDGTKNVEIAAPYLSKFCRTLEMALINCDINVILTRILYRKF